MSTLGPTELLIILGVVLLLFGSAKLPQLARSLGKSARILKAETKGLYEDETAEANEPARSGYENGPARPGGAGGPDQPGRPDRPALSSPAGSSSSPEREPAAPAADGHRPAPR
ncbi:twin-arginine translocase TatA/TatE family subunit [Actinomadura barringtoniae]|uniref:Sec-independent protein translocase protein TatA n=1 Tax=Actinomadura barringtoniae TaxID=1427535 RepID=A0A939PPL0_9ACTN|nr:twin-arginine translocase TatA/TatE family subunit [Actinomadura barringtoniae]MBO2453873.1 twin-arginine translocase TatA/TatE family subunit [Actinomadura barringtoniae]